MRVFVGNSKVDAEVAESPFKKFLGLMFRDKLDENRGMLFVFDKEDYHSFWMLFTKIPLEAIFISEDFQVVDIIRMEPFSFRSYKPKRKAKYVLEVNKGFSNRNNVKEGAKADFKQK